MSISVYSLAAAINESVNGGVQHDSIPAYEFSGSLIEACYEMDLSIMTESVCIDELMAMSDEIMAEAAINNPTVLDVLQENVFKSVKDAVIKFFNKIIAMIKGIIEKLKAAFYKMTNKIDEWYKIMEPKVKAAKLRVGGEYKVEAYNWQPKYITEELPDQIFKVMAGFDKGCKVSENIQKLDKIAGGKDAWTAAAGANADNADTVSGKIGKDLSNTEDGNVVAKEYVYSTMGFEKSDNAQDVIAKIDAKARGGSEKLTVDVGKDIDAMLTAVKDSKKTLETLKKSYETHEKDIIKLRNDVNKITEPADLMYAKQNDKRGDETKFNQTANNALVEALKTRMNYAKAAVATFDKCVGDIKTKNINYVEEMTKDYMTILSKYASAKGEKK